MGGNENFVHNVTIQQSLLCLVLSFQKYLDLFLERVKQMFNIVVYCMAGNGGGVMVCVL